MLNTKVQELVSSLYDNSNSYAYTAGYLERLLGDIIERYVADDKYDEVMDEIQYYIDRQKGE